MTQAESLEPSAPISLAAAREALPVLSSMLSTAELERRPSRPVDLEAENQALIELTQALATAPETILQKLAETALILCRAHSAGLSLLEEPDQKRRLHWRAIAGEWLLTEVEERRANLAHAARYWIEMPPCCVRIPSAIFPISAKLRRFWKKLC
jgi:hypothetical protein